jgi:RNA polymerase sigma-70 factor (ECF subfamily)
LAFELLHSLGLGTVPDAELLERYKRTKDQKWLSQLFGRYVHLIYGVCLRYSPDVREAEDMTMEIYQKIVSKTLNHQIKHFKSWIYVVAKNHCLEKIRKMTGRRTESFDPNFMQLASEIHPVDEKSSSDAVETKFKLLEECLKKLNEQQRVSIDLFYYQNKTYVEIAAIIEDEVSQIRSYLQNGRRNVKKCVERGTS